MQVFLDMKYRMFGQAVSKIYNRVGVVYKAKHEVCTQVVAFSLPGLWCS
jgi:hypothetical protein